VNVRDIGGVFGIQSIQTNYQTDVILSVLHRQPLQKKVFGTTRTTSFMDQTERIGFIYVSTIRQRANKFTDRFKRSIAQ
jgi:hypothetical protein